MNNILLNFDQLLPIAGDVNTNAALPTIITDKTYINENFAAGDPKVGGINSIFTELNISNVPIIGNRAFAACTNLTDVFTYDDPS